jgi:TldD protein
MMLPNPSPIDATDALFFGRPDAALDRDAAERIVGGALAGMDDGELFLEYRESEQLSLDDGHIRSAGFDTQLGFGLRAMVGEEAGYAHAGEISEAALSPCRRDGFRGAGRSLRYCGCAATGQ